MGFVQLNIVSYAPEVSFSSFFKLTLLNPSCASKHSRQPSQPFSVLLYYFTYISNFFCCKNYGQRS